MLKDILSSGALTYFATIGLVIFVLVFLGVVAWTLSRRQREIDDWSRIPLSKDDDPPIDDRANDSERRTNGGAA